MMNTKGYKPYIDPNKVPFGSGRFLLMDLDMGNEVGEFHMDKLSISGTSISITLVSEIKPYNVVIGDDCNNISEAGARRQCETQMMIFVNSGTDFKFKQEDGLFIIDAYEGPNPIRWEYKYST